MSYKCSVCGVNEVHNPGDMCELCAIGQDPYASGMTRTQQTTADDIIPESSSASGYSSKRHPNRKVLLNGGAALNNTDPYGNSISAAPVSQVKVYSAGQTPAVPQNSNTPIAVQTPAASSRQPITAGITKNITTDNQKRAFITKWFRALFSGIPFTVDDDITMFQVFPDFSGTSVNALGNACDQVLVYGKLNNGIISENNDVEVYGRRDSQGNIVAKTITNRATGTTIKPQRSLSAAVVWCITLAVLGVIIGFVSAAGIKGVILAAVILLVLTNLPLAIRIFGKIISFVFSLIKRL